MKTSRLSRSILGATLMAGAVAAQAQGGPTLGDVLTNSGIGMTGYLDASYNYLSRDGLFTSGTPDRVFDTEQNSFELNQAAVTISKTPTDGFGALVNLTGGNDAKVIHSYGGSTDDNFDVTQAYGQYAHGPWTVIMGKFVTLAGAEVISTPGNTNASRSILFGYAIPFTHTGARVSYQANSTLTLIGGVNNGWDQQKDENAQKTIEWGALWNPVQKLAFSFDGYYGDEPTGAGNSDVRNLIDVVGTLHATSSLDLVLNYDHGSQANAFGTDSSTATWDGVAAYANYKINDKWKTSLRGEYFDDKDGYRTGVAQKWKEATVTLAYMPVANVTLMGDVRYDVSDQSSFADENGNSSAKNQSSINLTALYTF